MRIPPELLTRLQQMPKYQRPMNDGLGTTGARFLGQRKWLQMQRAATRRTYGF
jgi:hypothetical protein